MKINITINLHSLLYMLAILGCTAKADTLFVSLKQADELFLKNNYRLLAQSFNIDAQKAQELQAKLFPNPVLSAEFNAYDPQNNKAVHIGQGGQMAFQLQQLIQLGGKRKNEIDLAKLNSKIAELEFNDLIRQLRYQLHSTLHELNQQTILLKKYNAQTVMLDTIIQAYEIQVQKNNIPLKDLIRLKSLSIQLSNEKMNLYKEHYQAQQRVQLLLNSKSYILTVYQIEDSLNYKINLKEQELLQLAQENRPDYQITETNKTLAEQYLKYQKSLAVPDLNVYTSYNRRGGAFLNELNAGVAVPLTIFNRNQGNVKSAKASIKIAELDQNLLKATIEAEIQNNFQVYKQSFIEYEKVMKMYSNDFDFTFNSISINFKKRNVTLLEFVDFFEAYNNVLFEVSKSKLNLYNSAELLNYSVSKDLF